MAAEAASAPERQPHPPAGVFVPFLLRRMWLTVHRRPGAAPRVAHDAAALLGDPSVTWIGHATLYVRCGGVSFLTDPVWSARCSPVSFAGPARHVPPGVPMDALPAVDFVLLSHDHYDHTDRATIRALAARGVPFFVPRGMKALLRGFGADATELSWWDVVETRGVRLHCVPAQHFSGRGLTDRNRRLWAGWVVEAGARRFYFAGDTGYFRGFAEIARRLGPPDLAALPIGAYLPRAMMQPVHMAPEEAVRAALDLGARQALGMHFGTFDLADEPLDEPPRRFLGAAAEAGLSPDRAFVLAVGETRAF